MAGVPLPPVQLRLQREDGSLARWDGQSPGEIQVRGPYITGSYAGIGSPPAQLPPPGPRGWAPSRSPWFLGADPTDPGPERGGGEKEPAGARGRPRGGPPGGGRG